MEAMRFFASVIMLLLAASGCEKVEKMHPPDLSGRIIKVVATTGMVADLVKNIGGERVEVTALMGPGVDPHMYKASERGVIHMSESDVVFYSGLHLEGAMTRVLERLDRIKPTTAVADGIDPSRLLSKAGTSGAHDPHIWFDVTCWMDAARTVHRRLVELDSLHAGVYDANLDNYLAQLQDLHDYVLSMAQTVPIEQRVLITAHDAFSYFGRAYGFEVRGLQGISTVTEAGAADVQQLADFIVRRRIPALFIESSVPRRNIEAVQAAVHARGYDVTIGGQLFSDAMGSPGTPEGNYIGMVRHNIDTIVAALTARPKPPAS